MKLLKHVGIVFLVFAVVFMVLAIIHDEVSIGIAFFIPFLMGSGIYAFLGFIFLFMALFFLFYWMGSHLNPMKNHFIDDTSIEGKASKKMSGVIFIGPVPIVFGLDKNLTKVLVLIAIFGVISLLLINLYLM
jgi:uncharacterized protein (TIGR00304 family)